MSRRLVERASGFLETRTSRRGFLRRAAVVGSALVAAPATFILRPGSAYSAVVRTPSSCPRGTRCGDAGWTELCCSLTGVNTCPPGSMVAGWWRAEYPGSGTRFCDGQSRYYMDCNGSSCGSCGCGGSGTCSSSCAGCACTCGNDSCSNWKTCCTRFRYGQCNQDRACLGPIICRVVTCVPPWEWDSSCTRTDAVSPSTYRHDAACLRPSSTYTARPGVYRDTRWLLRPSFDVDNSADSFFYGEPGDVPLMADWTGAGVKTAAVVRGARRGPAGDETLTWYIRQVEGTGLPDLVIRYGRAGDIPVVGDWDGDGVATIGVVRGNRWLLRNSNSSGAPDIDFVFGEPGDIPVVGRWTNDRAMAGMVRGTTWRVRTTDGGATNEFQFGSESGLPVVGDWNGNGLDRPGWFDDGTWSLADSLDTVAPFDTYQLGQAGDLPVVWGRVT